MNTEKLKKQRLAKRQQIDQMISGGFFTGTKEEIEQTKKQWLVGLTEMETPPYRFGDMARNYLEFLFGE